MERLTEFEVSSVRNGIVETRGIDNRRGERRKSTLTLGQLGVTERPKKMGEGRKREEGEGKGKPNRASALPYIFTDNEHNHRLKRAGAKAMCTHGETTRVSRKLKKFRKEGIRMICVVTIHVCSAHSCGRRSFEV